MKRKRSKSPTARSPRPSRSPRGTRASTRSPRSPVARLDLSQSTPKADPDEESLAAARRSSRGKKTLDYTESHNEVINCTSFANLWPFFVIIKIKF